MTKTSTKISVGKSGLIKKIFIIVGAGLAVSLAVVLTFLLISSMFSPVDVRVSNVTSNSATVSWVTDKASEGFAVPVEGEEAAVWKYVADKDAVTYDDRDYTLAELEAAKVNAEQATTEEGLSGEEFVTEVKVEDAGEYKVHHVTFRNLKPDTDYTFYVGDGKVLNRAAGDEGQSLFKTFSQKDDEVLSVPDPAYGKIYDESDFATITFDAIVYLEIVDDGAEKTSTLISAVVSKDSWYLDLNSAKDSETGDPFLSNVTLPNETVFHKVFVEGADLGTNDASFMLEADAPALPIGLPGSDSEESSSIFDFFVKDTYAWSMTCPNGKKYQCDASCEATFNAVNPGRGESAWKSEASGHCPDPNVPGVGETPQEPGNPSGNTGQCTDNVSCCGPNYANYIKNHGDSCSDKGQAAYCPSQGGCDAGGPLGCFKCNATGKAYCLNPGEDPCNKGAGETPATGCNEIECTGMADTKCTAPGEKCTKDGVTGSCSIVYPFTCQIPTPPSVKCSTANCKPPKTCDFSTDTKLGECVDSATINPNPPGPPNSPPAVTPPIVVVPPVTPANCTPVPGASCEGCQGKVSDGYACTDRGKRNIGFHWLNVIDRDSEKELVCTDLKGCICDNNGTHIEFGQLCINLTRMAAGKKTIGGGSRCTDSPNGCFCLTTGVTSHLLETQYCQDVSPGECYKDNNWENNKVCNKSGNTCQRTEYLHPITRNTKYEFGCTGSPPSSSSQESSTELIATSDSSSQEVLGVSNSIKISPSQGYLMIEEAGMYCTEDKGEKYCFEILNTGEHLLYIDTDKDNEYTEGVDKNIAADGTEVKLEMESSIDTFKVSEGFNLVSFKSVFSEDSNMASVFLTKLNEEYNDSFYQIAKFDNGWKVVGDRDGDSYGSNDFQIIPGEGYLLRSKNDMIIELSGQRVASAVPVNLKAGWNLIGLHGATKSYTAESLIDSMNAGGIKSDNVTRWVEDKSKYEGLQKQTDSAGVKNVYGFDFPITSNIGYFVQVREAGGQWKPE